jgi:hypothetical protein
LQAVSSTDNSTTELAIAQPVRDRSDDPYRQYRAAGTVLAVLVLLLIGLELVRNARHPIDHDFVSFWGAARLALAGPAAAAYDPQTLRELQAQFVTFPREATEMPFPYPPAFLLILMPFAVLPFAAAMATWSLVTIAGWLAVIRRIFPASGWLALGFPAIYATGAIGQNGALTAAVLCGGLLLLPQRPFVAGLVLGFLVLKPQLALLLPVAMLAGREWRAIAGGAVSAAALLLGGLVLFSEEATRAWIGQMPLYAEIARNGLVGWSKLASVYAAARQAGVPLAPAIALHAAVAALAAWTVWRTWRSAADPLLKMSVLIAATMLASPYLFFYDAVILTVPLLFLVERKAPPPLIAALWLAPALSVALVTMKGPININPLIPLCVLAMLLLQMRQAGDWRLRLS